MAKTRAEKQAAKQQKQQERYTAAAADGKISRDELQGLFGKRSMLTREQQATELAKFAMGNPNVQIGKNVSQQTGLRIRADEAGNRVATYAPEMVTPLRNPNSSQPQAEQATANFGRANPSWLAIGGGRYRFGGAPNYTISKPTEAAAPTESAQPEVTVSDETMRYRSEAEQYLRDADAILNQFKIDQEKANQLQMQTQATLASNLAASQRTPNLQIAPASQTAQTAGTQSFKRRPTAKNSLQMTSSLNI